MYGSRGRYEGNPNGSQEDQPPSLFLHFPSPFLDSNEPVVLAEKTPPKKRGRMKKITTSDSRRNPSPRRRTGKKDRHSKIHTAQGLRDRRMRLSVQIARKFFDLQDMLAFDKASKTIEWLFSKSKGAIKELQRTLPTVGGCIRGGQKSPASLPEEEGAEGETLRLSILDEKKDGKSRKMAYNMTAKESRDKARERARERTREKFITRSLEKSKQYCVGENPNSMEQSGFSSGPHSLENQLGILENFLGAASSSATPPVLVNFQNILAENGEPDSSNTFLGVLGNWDTGSGRISSDYCALMRNLVSPVLTGSVQEQNPNSTSNFHHHHHQSLFLGDNFSFRPL